jgi:hypothetical protein
MWLPNDAPWYDDISGRGFDSDVEFTTILHGYMNTNSAAYWVERVQGSLSSGQPSEPVLQSLQQVARVIQRHVCFSQEGNCWILDSWQLSA